MRDDDVLLLPWLLVATPQLTDPNFRQKVVLVIEHSPKGALGFVLNKPLETPLASIVEPHGVDMPAELAAWFGGPVASDSGIILRDRTTHAGRGDDEAVSLSLASSPEALQELAADAKIRLAQIQAGQAQAAQANGLYPYRFLVGYAGWGAGQLEEEMHGGAWVQMRATWRLLFATDWRTLWDQAFGTIGIKPRQMAPASHQYLN